MKNKFKKNTNAQQKRTMSTDPASLALNVNEPNLPDLNNTKPYHQTTRKKILSRQTKILIIVISVLLVFIVAGIVIAILLTRNEGQMIVVTPTPTITPSPTPTPIRSQTFNLKTAVDGQCYNMTKFNSVFNGPLACGSKGGQWLDDLTNNIISFSGSNYTSCIQTPEAKNQRVFGQTNFSLCTNIEFENNTIKSTTNSLCINATANAIWDDCSNATTFFIDPI